MITVKNIELRLKRIDYTRPSPTRERLEELVADGRSRILKAAQIDGLCPESDRYFEFCLSQVGSFCTASYNAVEIALCIGLQPIHVAAAISVHGFEWSHRLLGLKRFAALDRGSFTVWKSADAWFSLGEAQRRAANVYGDQTISVGQSKLRQAIRTSNMDVIRQIAQAHPHRVMSVLAPRHALYTDPRAEKARREREAKKKELAAEGKKLAERGSYNDLGTVFNGPITKPDRTRGIDDSSQTRSTVSGRRFRV
ncbi:hypothetical protein MPK64_gp015 [Erwinia phage pEa_SNUABM_16]|uniref:Uncharacterized protein n=1 Tax=Erwinia phage pEa_SNUABM_16 TaxID=2869544 RepID=A0AAE9BU55_9CAUD|nr:hypothetical protein MPK64_gp015 [Erwinia phage pEa_SNUABM_16]QZE58918.1 hypothetical protein pEaSNUABM18_00015 [Erwinia phage pEa_SNUABM_18]UAW96159.1 hypothetical protein pEaSNUABM16_00015 [Erwinia phage pEa_SNUABM_16]